MELMLHAATVDEMELMLHAATVDEMELTFHLIHGSSRQQYWFDDNLTLYVQFVLLIMGGGTA